MIKYLVKKIVMVGKISQMTESRNVSWSRNKDINIF